MDSYKKYIKELKGLSPKIDYDKAYTAIALRAQPKPANSWLIAAALTGVFLAVFSLYYTLNPGGNKETIASYLEEGETINGNILMSYVFGE
ncbi:MAG: hypothetical protein ABIH50_01080 [bacterium]